MVAAVVSFGVPHRGWIPQARQGLKFIFFFIYMSVGIFI